MGKSQEERGDQDLPWPRYLGRSWVSHRRRGGISIFPDPDTWDVLTGGEGGSGSSLAQIPGTFMGKSAGGGWIKLFLVLNGWDVLG